MHLSMDIIEKKLKPIIIDSHFSSSELCLVDVRYISNSNEECTNEHVYLSDGRTFPDPIINKGKKIHMVLPESPGLEIPDHIEYIIVHSMSLFELSNVLQEIFLLYYNWEHDLYSLLNEHASLQRILETSVKIIEYPLDILDVSEGVLAATKNGDFSDVVWQELHSGFISSHTKETDSIKAEDIIRNEGPAQFFSSISNRYMLSTALRVNHHVVGFLSAHMLSEGTEMFPESTIHEINYLTRFLVQRMNYDDFNSLSRGWIYESLIRNLIEEKKLPLSYIKDREQMLSFSTKGEKQFVILRSLKKQQSQRDLGNYKTIMESMYPGFHGLIFDDSLVGLFFNANTSPVTYDSTNFINWLIKNDLKCGLSTHFYNLSEVYAHFKQADSAIMYGDAMNNELYIYDYSDYAIWDSFAILSESIDLRSLLHPIIFSMQKNLDKVPFLYETLCTYLFNERNINEASNQLFIHKNTMRYRLKVIEDNFDLQLDDNKVRTQLIYSFYILEYMTKFMNYNFETDSFDNK